MVSATSWRFTAYTLPPVAGDGRTGTWEGTSEAGATIRPFSGPVVFDGRDLEGRAYAVELADARPSFCADVQSSPPGPDSSARSGDESPAIGRVISARYERQPGDPASVRVCATLSSTFQVARCAVPAGASLGERHGLSRLSVRLRMPPLALRGGAEGRNEEETDPRSPAGLAAFSQGGAPYGQLVPSKAPRSVGKHLADAPPVDVGAGRPHPAHLISPFVRPEEAPHGEEPRGADRRRVPGSPRRTFSIGWGWESPADPESAAFGRIVRGRAESLLALDARHAPGWSPEFDLSWLLRETAPEDGGEPAPRTFWLGVWTTSDADHPLDFPYGGPWLTVPGTGSFVGTAHEWIDEQSSVLGYWRLIAE